MYATFPFPVLDQALRVLSLHCVRSPDVERNDRVSYITKAQKTVTNPANQYLAIKLTIHMSKFA